MRTRAFIATGLAASAVLLGGCGGSTTSSSSSSPDSSSSSSYGVATDCTNAIVQDNGDGTAAISANLNGDWPTDPRVIANVTFSDNSTPQQFEGDGQSVTTTDPGGGSVLSAYVSVVSGSAPRIDCGYWAKREGF